VLCVGDYKLVRGSECAAGGFLLCLCVCWYCVVVSRGN